MLPIDPAFAAFSLELLDRLTAELEEVKRLLASSREAKANPNWRLQPRAPPGAPNGGQWIDGGGSGASARPGDTNLTPVADWNRQPINLAAHERSPGRPNGGHAIRDHVGKPVRELIARIHNAHVFRLGRGGIGAAARRPYAVGSFTSLSDANALVNATLLRNQAIVRRVARGELLGNQHLYVRFGSVTGYEAYHDSRTNMIRTRNTYGVAIVIRHDPHSPVGFVIRTAYPANNDPSVPSIRFGYFLNRDRIEV